MSLKEVDSIIGICRLGCSPPQCMLIRVMNTLVRENVVKSIDCKNSMERVVSVPQCYTWMFAQSLVREMRICAICSSS